MGPWKCDRRIIQVLVVLLNIHHINGRAERLKGEGV